MYTLGELAKQLDLVLTGDARTQVTGLASLTEAGPDKLAFLSRDTHLPRLAATRAAAVILRPEHAGACPVDCLLAENPYLAFARATRLFDFRPVSLSGVHPGAWVDADARVHPEASVGACAVVEAGAVVEEGVVLGPGVYIGQHSHVGADTRIFANAVVYHNVHIGRRCVVHAQAVLGADGFGFARGPGGWEKIHQLGGLRIGDGVEIGAGTTIDRGTLEDTLIEDGVIIDNQVQVAHNCRIGRGTAIAGCCGIAGSSIIGANCTLAGGVGVVGHIEICDNVHVTGMTMVTRSITAPGSYSSGTPMTATRDWKRSAVRFTQLDAMHRRLTSLERPSPAAHSREPQDQ